jgi:hypothetical protein
MSCNDCEDVQKLNKEGKCLAFLRIGNANVLIGACDKHFNELRRQLGIIYDKSSSVNRVRDEKIINFYPKFKKGR